MQLATTYLDERVRLGKGSRGSLFVFERSAAADAAGGWPLPSCAAAAAVLLLRRRCRCRRAAALAACCLLLVSHQ